MPTALWATRTAMVGNASFSIVGTIGLARIAARMAAFLSTLFSS